jgi:hypothetical protein
VAKEGRAARRKEQILRSYEREKDPAREQRALSLLLCPVYTPFLVRYIFMNCAPSKSRSCCSAILASPSTQLISIAKAEAIPG